MTNREQELLLAEAVKADEPAAIFALMDHIQEHRDRIPDGERQRNFCRDCKYSGRAYSNTVKYGYEEVCSHPVLFPIVTNYATGSEKQTKGKCEDHNQDGLCKFFTPKRIKKSRKKA